MSGAAVKRMLLALCAAIALVVLPGSQPAHAHPISERRAPSIRAQRRPQALPTSRVSHRLELRLPAWEAGASTDLEGAGGAQRRASAASNDRGRHQSGKLLPPDDGTPYPGINQPLRWQGRWFFNGQGIDLYDFRNRVWSPELGAFLSPDDFIYHRGTGTLWSWPGQNPIRHRDPSGHISIYDFLSPDENQALTNWDTNTSAMNFLRESSYRAFRVGDYGTAALDAAAAVAVSAYGYLNTEEGQTAAAIVGGVSGMGGGSRGACRVPSMRINMLDPVPSPKGLGQRPTVLQTGGHTLSPQTLDALGLDRGTGKRAMEGLKRDNALPPSFHETKILSNGDIVNSHTGKRIGNIFEYVP
ncbi:MAG: hypothetical protein IPI67_17895 [Myxococcales bacterium]|nr:hypothetical protein [Myxococcales bacterium]